MNNPRKGLADKRNRHDPAYLRAKRENRAGRAIYKLEEIDQKFRLLKPGTNVLDLGCWPGGWLQVAAEAVGPGGRVVASKWLPPKIRSNRPWNFLSPFLFAREKISLRWSPTTGINSLRLGRFESHEKSTGDKFGLS